MASRMISALHNGVPTGSGATGRIVVAAALAWGCGTATLAQTPRPAPKSPAALEAIKQRDQELDSLRAEQRKANEAEQKLTIENNSVAEDRRKLNQNLIDSAAHARSAEERVAAAEI